MEKYIDKLKNLSQIERATVSDKGKEIEKISAQNPCVVCCVTMGKEPHLGHLFLLTIAEQVQSGLGSKLPVILINNNTGPRAAGALVSLSENSKSTLVDTAAMMNEGVFDPSTIVEAYRSRSNEPSQIEEAQKVLEAGEVDIFSAVAKETEQVLKRSGYTIEIVSEAKLLKMAGDKTESLNPAWSGTGFVPFFGDKRVVVLQKAGNMTATGALLTSVRELTSGVGADLTVIVDSQPDVCDVAFVQTAVEEPGTGVQVLGAGVGFGGEIASGTKGEAVTIKEVSKEFYRARPKGNLKKAALFLTLTRQLYFYSKSQNMGESFYNFKSNEEALLSLVGCCDELERFNNNLFGEMEQLSTKIADKTVVEDKATQKFMEFLPQKSVTLLLGEPERVLSESKKTVMGVRQNYYFGYLNGLRKIIQKIESLTEEEFLTIGSMIEFCIERTGI